jgi:lauroyl/myristoyl acyltransferase
VTSVPAQEPLDFSQIIQEIDRRAGAPAMPPARPHEWIVTSPWLRRLVPRATAIDRAERSGVRAWERDHEQRAHALSIMETVVAGTEQADALAEHARRHLSERRVIDALFWHRWLTPSIDADSLANCRAALDSGRGVFVSSCHLGAYFFGPWGLRALGCHPYVVCGAWWFEPPSHDYWGRRLAHWRKTQSWLRFVRASGSYGLLRELLRRGEPVMSYFDVPGARETHFLGKPAMLADGTARLAVDADALILPLRVRRAGDTLWVDLAPALDPRELLDVDAVHRALAHQHERWILEYPAALENPREIGWNASPEAWLRPRAPA